MQTEWKANTGKWALLVRSVSTLLLARRISRSVQKLERELQEQKVDVEDAKLRWLELHRANAKLTHKHILKYRGFLTKVGQAASIKAGDLPAPWVEELRGLQDELPVSPFPEVRRTVRADLGKPLEQIFHHFEQRPIASASVAQAHRAWLRSDNRKVCVKVQHRGVASMMGTDLATVELICSRMAKYHPEAPDATDLIREWRRASREEVDFRLEARNALQALNALRRAKVDISCPEPVQHCCGRRVLTMAYINGWKITDLHRLPFGTNREALVRPLVNAFALLAFEQGLIHGDPHPGNVFVEPLEPSAGSQETSSTSKVRVALLDWGIVQRMSEYERNAAARWVVATLAQDRVMYLKALVDLGFVFDVDFDSSDFAGFMEASMGSSAWMFRDSIPSGSQQNFLEKLRQHQESAEQCRHRAPPRTAKQGEKLVSKIPGVILFFLRGLEMLQNICGTLEVAVPFAAIVLQHAMPLLEAGVKAVPCAMPAPQGCSELEVAVRARLQELEEAGVVLGAQVAVLRGSVGNSEDWLCRVSVGRCGVAGLPVTDASLLPLLDASVGVLLLCLLSVLAHPTVTGREVSLDSPAVQLWPDFAQRDKGKLTIGQLLQHRAGLSRVFPVDLSLKGFCSEHRLEQILAALPCERNCGEGACRVMGNMAAALLRRAVGHRHIADALRIVLEPLGLQEHIVYRGPERRMAFVGKKPRESLPMEKVWEWLEEKVDMMEMQPSDAKPSNWLTWRELAFEKPGYTDPLLVNREILRSGDGCLPARGLRASAEALCRLYSSDIVPAALLEQSRKHARRLLVESQEEFRDLGSCLDVGEGGWQLFRFRKLDGGEGEVIAHGYADGSTGSVALRLPDASVAVLLNSADKDTRHAGHALLSAAVAQFGLKPAWELEDPSLPEKVPRRGGDADAKGSASSGNPRFVEDGCPGGNKVPPEAQETISKMEAKVARLTQALAAAGVTLEEEEEEAPPPGLSGSWNSAETEGLQALLEAFEVPAMVRTFAQAARRTLKVHVQGDKVRLMTTTCFMGRQVEETVTDFVVGEAFEGEQELGGAFKGLATWVETEEPNGADAAERNASASSSALNVEKHFDVGGREVIVVERLSLNSEGRLALCTTLRAAGRHSLHLRTQEELQYVCGNLEEGTLRLAKEVQLEAEHLPRGGRVVGAEASMSLSDLSSMPVPLTLTFQYDDLQSTTMFDRQGGNVSRKRPKSSDSGASANPFGGGASPSDGRDNATLSGLADRILTQPGSSQLPDCAVGVMALCWAASTFMSSAAQTVGRTADAVCSAARTKRMLLPNAQRALTGPQLEPLLQGASRLSSIALEPSPSASSSAGVPLHDEEYAIRLDRCNGKPLGIEVLSASSGHASADTAVAAVTSVTGSMIEEWNAANPVQVRLGDRVLEVNGIRGDARKLVEECGKAQALELKLCRGKVWRCCWEGGIRVRAAPEVDAKWVGKTVALNEIVLVSQEHRGADGVVYLRLADGRGWVFESKPDLGVVCVRHEVQQEVEVQQDSVVGVHEADGDECSNNHNDTAPSSSSKSSASQDVRNSVVAAPAMSGSCAAVDAAADAGHGTGASLGSVPPGTLTAAVQTAGLLAPVGGASEVSLAAGGQVGPVLAVASPPVPPPMPAPTPAPTPVAGPGAVLAAAAVDEPIRAVDGAVATVTGVPASQPGRLPRTGLPLAMPARQSAARAQFDAAATAADADVTPAVGSCAPAAPPSDARQFSVVLRRRGNSLLGLRAGAVANGTELLVQSIAEGGLVVEWNTTSAPERRVGVGDKIVSVNGRSGDAKSLVEELSKCTCVLDLCLQRAKHRLCDNARPGTLGQAAPEPKPHVVTFEDPRSVLAEGVGIIGFYCREQEEPWDTLCGSSFLGSHYDLGHSGFQLEAPCARGKAWTFRNSEAAFQALKFWLLAGEFSGLSGQAAVKKKRRLSGHEDLTYAGFGSSWKGMLAVLRAKFAGGTPLAVALLKTGEAFLLEHNPVEGRDDIWSDDGTGEGRNWLGMQLMLVRDQLSGQSLWSHHIASLVDLESGRAFSTSTAEQWQDTVRRATGALVNAVVAGQRQGEPVQADQGLHSATFALEL